MDGVGDPGARSVNARDDRNMEEIMQHASGDHAGDSCLRFVFSDAVVSLPLSADATFEDIAWSLRGLKTARHGKPLAIDVVLANRRRAR